jgi:hypothetical protein
VLATRRAVVAMPAGAGDTADTEVCLVPEP